VNDRELLRLLDELGTPSVLILGDLILDQYVTGEVRRISPEGPIPVLAARHTELRLGGAGNVAANLRSMGAEVQVLGVIGRDRRGDRLLGLLDELGADADGILRIEDRPTTEKTRMIGGAQQMLRVDWEDAGAIDEATARRLGEELERRVAGVGAVVLSDYGKGVLRPELLRAAIDTARRANVPVLVDPKGSDYTRYRGATLVTPNRREAEEALGRDLGRIEETHAAAAELAEQAELDAAVVTLGSDGMVFHARPSGRFQGAGGRVPAMARAVFDVTGAGDTVIALLALTLAAGRGLTEAVELANHAAGLVVGRRGAASVTRDELAALLGGRKGGSSHVLRREDLPGVLAEWRAEGRRIVFTNGCFDIVHAGHVDYLRTARSRGDVLIVGMNDDGSIGRLKGPERPINCLEDRMAVLAALEMVDAVVPFSEDTPLELVREITPDVLVKGEDWEDKGVVGREWVEEHGGEVFLAPLLPGRSTTSIVDRLRGSGAPSTG